MSNHSSKNSFFSLLDLIDERNTFIKIVVFAVIASFLEIIQLGSAMFLIDAALTNEEIGTKFNSSFGISINQNYIFSFIALISICSGFISLGYTFYSSLKSGLIAGRINTKAYEIYVSVRKRFIVNVSLENLIQLINNESDRLSIGVINPVSQLIYRISSLIFMLPVLFIISWKATSLSLIILSILYLFFFNKIRNFLSMVNIMRTEKGEERIEISKLAAFAKRELVIFNLEQDIANNFKKINDDYFRYYSISHALGLSPRIVFESLAISFLAITFIAASILSSLQIALLGSFAVCLLRIIPGIQSVFANFTTLLGNKNCINVYVNFFDQLSSEHNQIYSVHTSSIHNIAFDNVTIDNPGDKSKKIIENFSYNLKKGHSYLIKGPSGSGKSSILDILIGFSSISAGKIFINGKPVPYSQFDVLDKISFVGQDVIIFKGSLQYNIILNEELDEDRLKLIVNLSGLDDLWKRIEKENDQELAWSDSRLSGGEKQRVAIARALYKKSEIIIFDEATNGLDEALEELLVENILNFSKESIIIFVSHNTIFKKKIKNIIDLGENNGLS